MLALQVDANNMQLLEQHVCCASAELPVTLEEDGQYFGPGLSAAMDALVCQGQTVVVNNNSKINLILQCLCCLLLSACQGAYLTLGQAFLQPWTHVVSSQHAIILIPMPTTS